MRLNYLTLVALIGCLVLSCQKSVDDTDPDPDPPGNSIPLAVTAIAPTHGAGGTNITITGTGFSATSANNTIQINGKTATVVSAKDNELVVTIPIKAGSGAVTVKVGDKTATGPNLLYDTTWMVSTFAGSGTAGFADGSGTAAQFKSPTGICVDADGNLYITDRGNNKIRMITSAGLASTLAGSTQGFADGPAASAQFTGLTGIARTGDGTIYVADYNAHAIRKLSAGTVTTVAGGTDGYQPGGTAVAKFSYPGGVCVNTNGILYIADGGNSIIRYLQFGTVNNLCGYPCFSGYKDGWANGAYFTNPNGICIDAKGTMYVADTYGQKIRKVTPIGDVTTVAGQDMKQGKQDGPGNEATFFQPWGICVDTAGVLYVADTENSAIRKITPDGMVTTIAGTGTAGKADGIGTAATFNKPFGIAVDAQGALYVADTQNHLIRKIVYQ